PAGPGYCAGGTRRSCRRRRRAVAPSRRVMFVNHNRGRKAPGPLNCRCIQRKLREDLGLPCCRDIGEPEAEGVFPRVSPPTLTAGAEAVA
ncbi:MAG: hypothetical protein VW338_17175, partial [Rhodospirillaceae bacterium]